MAVKISTGKKMRQNPQPSRLLSATDPLIVGLFLAPGFGLPAFSELHELFYLLNRANDGEAIISCSVITIDGAPVKSSSGRAVEADRSIRDQAHYDLILVLSAVSNFTHKPTAAWLRDQRRHGTVLGSVTSGLWLLADGGLIGGSRCTIHWADIDAFREKYPKINLTADIFVIEDDLLTCAGFGAVPGMMYAYLEHSVERSLLETVMESLVMDRVRGTAELQRTTPGQKFGTDDRLVIAAAYRIEASVSQRNIVETLSQELGVSQRWLQILFKRDTGMSIKTFQTRCRIDRAKQLLRATSLQISQIAIMTGFSDGAHLTKTFRLIENRTPVEYRKTLTT